MIGTAKNDLVDDGFEAVDPHAPSSGTARANVSAHLRVPTAQSVCSDQGAFGDARPAHRPSARMVSTVSAMDHDKWSVLHFSQSNPDGPGQGDVPALLRRVAKTIEDLGDVDVQDITFHSEVTAEEDDLTMTVYHHGQPRRR